jgi:tryptophan synthase beta chain
VIGREAREQIMAAEGRLPDLLVAAIGGGSNAIGLFHPSSTMPTSRCSASRRPAAGSTAAPMPLAGGRGAGRAPRQPHLPAPDEDGQIAEAHSISAGLDYPGIGPEHSWLHEIGRVVYESATDQDALDAFQFLCRTEGIIPALEPSHAMSAVIRRARTMPQDAIIIANLCGRGDKDIFTVAEALGVQI